MCRIIADKDKGLDAAEQYHILYTYDECIAPRI